MTTNCSRSSTKSPAFRSRLRRLDKLASSDYALDIDEAWVHGNVLDAFAEMAQSRMSEDCRMVLQALAVFDEPIDGDAVKHVLAPYLTEDAIEAGIEEVRRTRFASRVPNTQKLSIHRVDKEICYRLIERSKVYDQASLHRLAAQYYDLTCEDRESSGTTGRLTASLPAT